MRNFYKDTLLHQKTAAEFGKKQLYFAMTSKSLSRYCFGCIFKSRISSCFTHFCGVTEKLHAKLHAEASGNFLSLALNLR